MKKSRRLYFGNRKATRRYADFHYQTQKSWRKSRRVVGKAEYLEKGSNPRFIVTNLDKNIFKPQMLYEEIYCARGDMENRIKEQQLDMFADRTSTALMKSSPALRAPSPSRGISVNLKRREFIICHSGESRNPGSFSG